MKRASVTLCLFLCGLFSFAQSMEDLAFGTDSTFEVMTWNLEWFPKNDQTTIDYVSQIIEALDVDLLAIQEVDDVIAFETLVDGLGNYSGYLESSYFAGLAYLYKTDLVQINEIYEIYTTEPYWSPFPRSPMVMDLNFGNERIIVINNHYKCCGDGILDLADPDDEETRRYIAGNLLKDFIDSDLPGENTILTGDLNDILTDDSANNVFQMFLDEGANYLFADLGIAAGNESEWSYPGWPSHLDHILLTRELFDEFETPGSEIRTIKPEEYMPGGWSFYDANVSDHRPVALKLRMNSWPNNADPSRSTLSFTNYPNPFNFQTRFSFDISDGSRELRILNIQGQLVFSVMIPGGSDSFIWNAESLPDGIYIAKLVSGHAGCATLKLILNNSY